MARKFNQVSYLGVLPAGQAADLLPSYSFGLMPIDDEVTNYAFPSKSSSYVFSGCQVVAICGAKTSVADWVMGNQFGFVVDPNVDAVTSLFHELESRPVVTVDNGSGLFERLTPLAHANSLESMVKQVAMG